MSICCIRPSLFCVSLIQVGGSSDFDNPLTTGEFTLDLKPERLQSRDYPARVTVPGANPDQLTESMLFTHERRVGEKTEIGVLRHEDQAVSWGIVSDEMVLPGFKAQLRHMHCLATTLRKEARQDGRKLVINKTLQAVPRTG